MDERHIRELVRRCRKGDEAAWEELLLPLTVKATMICRKWRLSSDETMEVIGACNAYLLEHLKNLRQPEKLFSYYHTMIINEIQRRNRDDDRLITSAEKIRETLYQRTAEKPDDILMRKRREERVLVAVAKLPPKCLKLMCLLFFDDCDWSYKEIAKEMGIPISSIGPTRRRCLDKLMKILIDDGFKF